MNNISEKKENEHKNGLKITPAILVLVSAVFVLLSRFALNLVPDNTYGYIGTAFLQVIIFLLPGIFYVRFSSSGRVWSTDTCLSKKDFSSENMSFRFIRIENIFLIISSFLFLVFSTLVLDMIFHGIKYQTGSFGLYSTFEVSKINTPYAAIYPAVAFALIPAVCEEFFFRGVLMCSYKKQGFFAAALTSTVFYMIFSFNPAFIPSSFVAGLCFCFILFASKSLYVCMVVHFLYNLYGIFLRTNIADYYTSLTNKTLIVIMAVFFLVLAVFLFASELSRIFSRLSSEDDNVHLITTHGAKNFLISIAKNFLNIPSAACAVMYIASYAVEIFF